MNKHFRIIPSLVVLGLLLAGSGCSKTEDHLLTVQSAEKIPAGPPALSNNLITQDMRIVKIYNHPDGSISVLFSESARIYRTTQLNMITGLQKAFKQNRKVRVTCHSIDENLLEVWILPEEASRENYPLLVSEPGRTVRVDLANSDAALMDDPAFFGMKGGEPSVLTNVIPDIATAQTIFNYLVQQSCPLPGPLQIDQCIPFQYAQDGCHARAHKMCWVINKKFQYDTHKIFSIANDQVGEWLSVKALKWGGCCLKWWFHVAALVNVNTPGGVKAYVMDPSMFDQPVLLSQWLHAQENPFCYSNPKVSTISLQPNSSYKPVDVYGQAFTQDPYYSYTNSTLNNYSSYITCQ